MPKFRNPIVGGDVLLIPAIQSQKQNLDGSGPAWNVTTDGFATFATVTFNKLTGTTVDGFSSTVTAFDGEFNTMKFGLPLKSVSVGAADSGGAGFRLLRVAN